MKIVFACNDSYFDGLYLSILSIVRRCKKDIEFYLLTADYSELDGSYKVLSSEHTKILSDLVKQYNQNNSFTVIDCTKEAKTKLVNYKNIRKHFSPYANLRLLIHLFHCFTDKVIYLDTDIMACGDIQELYNIDIKDYEMAVCHNWWLRHTFAKGTFNSGVIVFNMEQIRKTKLLEKAIDYFNKIKMAWADQTAMVKAATKICYFPGDEYRFNRQSEKVHEGDILKHFCNRPWGWPFWNNIKQWDIKNVHKHLKIFVFDEDYKIYLVEKEKWKNK